jgi:hypothetical protein
VQHLSVSVYCAPYTSLIANILVFHFVNTDEIDGQFLSFLHFSPGRLALSLVLIGFPQSVHISILCGPQSVSLQFHTHKYCHMY